MSWLYYSIREQYNLLTWMLLNISKLCLIIRCYKFSGSLNDCYQIHVCGSPTSPPRTSTVTHPEWDSHNWPIKNQAMSEKWVRILSHLQQLHIYVIIELKIVPFHSLLPKTRLAGLSPALIRFQSVTHSVTELKKWQDVVPRSTNSLVVLASTFTQIHRKPWDCHG